MNQERRSTILTWVAWSASRAGILMLIAYAQAQAHVLTDVRLYERWYHESLSHGAAPNDAQWNYPPGAAVTLWIAGLMTPYIMGLIVMLLVSDGLILRTVRRRSADSWGVAFWIVAPFLLGPVVLARFDLVPTMFAATGLLAGPLAAGALLSIGGLVKAWPAVLLVVRAAGESFAHVRRMALGAIASGVGMLAVIAATGQWGSLTTWLHGNGARGLQIESIAATPWDFARALGADLDAPFNHGSVQIVGPGTTMAATICSGLGLFVIVWGVWVRYRGADLAATAAAVLMGLMVTAKVLSPQYLIWAVALVALSRSRRAMVLLGTACLLTQAVFPIVYVSFVNAELISTVIFVLRNVLLVWCTVVLVRDAHASIRERAVMAHFDDYRPLDLSAFIAETSAAAADQRLPQPRRSSDSVVPSEDHVQSLSTHALPAAPSSPAR